MQQIFSNKSTNQMHQSLRFIAHGGSSAVGRGWASRPKQDQQQNIFIYLFTTKWFAATHIMGNLNAH
jgi:hypothetical protein